VAARALAKITFRVTRLIMNETEKLDLKTPQMKPKELYDLLEDHPDPRWDNTLENFLGDVPEMLIDTIVELFENFDYNNQSMSHRAIAIRMLMVILYRLKESLANGGDIGSGREVLFRAIKATDTG